MPFPTEANIVINGVTLTHAQAMTVRVAIASLRSDMATHGLGDDEHGKFMAQAYLDRGAEVETLLFSHLPADQQPTPGVAVPIVG
jgi:hypothetical protein